MTSDGRTEPRVAVVFTHPADLEWLLTLLEGAAGPRAEQLADTLEDALTRLQRKRRRR